MHPRPLAAAAIAVGLAVACGPRTHAVVMNTENNSGQNGTAVLTEVSKGRTRVDVSLKASDDARPQPIHIHSGHCGQIGSVLFNLTPAGPDPRDPTHFVSSTEIDAGFDDLRTTPHAINAHDVRDFSLYVACGNTDAP